MQLYEPYKLYELYELYKLSKLICNFVTEISNTKSIKTMRKTTFMAAIILLVASCGKTEQNPLLSSFGDKL